jgi:hypothetical protein
MHSNHPPHHRPIEIVPLGDPIDATPQVAAVETTVGAWPVPSVRSSVHPPVVLDEPLIDLTEPVAPAPVEATIATLGAAGPLVLGQRRERLRDLIAREREELEHTATVVSLPHPAPEVAPFPIPGMAVIAPAPVAPLAPAVESSGPRRVPKAVRPDAAGRPLTDDVAAAIARLADRSPDVEVEPVQRLTRHIEIVPLEELPPPPPAFSEVIDLRERLAGAAGASAAAASSPSETPRCPACNHPGELDIVDRANGLARYGCGHCFRVWSHPLD